MSFEMSKKLSDAVAVVSAQLVTQGDAIKVLKLHQPQYIQMVKAGTITLDTTEVFGRKLYFRTQVEEVAKTIEAKRAERAAKTGKTQAEKDAEKAQRAADRQVKAEAKVAEKAAKAVAGEAAKAEKAAAKVAATNAKIEAKKVKDAEKLAAAQAKVDAAAAKLAQAAANPTPASAPVATNGDGLEGLNTSELRNKAKEVGVSPVGSAETVIARIRAKNGVAPAPVAAPATVSLDDLLA